MSAPNPPVRKPLPLEATLLVRLLTLLSIGTLGFVGYVLVASQFQQERGQNVLYSAMREQLADDRAPLGGAIDLGTPVAVLDIPSLNVHQVVVEGSAGEQLAQGPGHRRNSPLPGQVGTSVLMGRARTFGGPFKDITRLHPTDEIVATTGQGRFTYRVDRIRREGEPAPLAEKGVGRLILVSAEGDGWLGPDRSVLVDATLDGKPQPAPTGRPRSQLAEETPMMGDQAGLVGLVLWLQALLLVVCVFVWARRRWGRWESWLAGMPILLAVGWNVCQSAAITFLPNLL